MQVGLREGLSSIYCHYIKRKIRHKGDTRDVHTMLKATQGHSEKMAVCKSRRWTSEETKPASLLSWIFSFQNMRKYIVFL